MKKNGEEKKCPMVCSHEKVKRKGKYEPKKMKFESAISLKHFFSYNLKY